MDAPWPLMYHIQSGRKWITGPTIANLILKVKKAPGPPVWEIKELCCFVTETLCMQPTREGREEWGVKS